MRAGVNLIKVANPTVMIFEKQKISKGFFSTLYVHEMKVIKMLGLDAMANNLVYLMGERVVVAFVYVEEIPDSAIILVTHVMGLTSA